MEVLEKISIQNDLRPSLAKVLGITHIQLRDARPHQLRSWLSIVDLRLKRERNRGCVKHYRYDINNHIAVALLRREIRRLLGDDPLTS